ncbi:DNA-formamidopyrimidine glycosylase [Candidatus Peregrinibacteria bacterium RIFOXYC2_FULL_33_13]|nr:MAG: Formamidopyrimidine-DNA glycosylase [Candidatus Peregrinibacteria bacterium GW2011_GWA2_33_10]KKP41299.1 MAG: formamidopyrimidine-DNA glycosylase, formamidopyrimidine-DNA glycosylase [Candidatus Peregrinibacteria bacterium GW2011_GWC2_33_13]OGJ54322.1 MAG: DNA-formamidopyrimidine glycosylase [Candidatus Peregrinibacteria bacterium RIFOXYC2_FULL_33_13]
MPELPEVEILARDLKNVIEKKRIKNIEILNESTFKGEKNDLEKIINKRVVEVFRRGKFLVVFLENNFVLCAHLRMTGKFSVKKHTDPKLKFERVRFDFENFSLCFSDQRKFGKIWLCQKKELLEFTGMKNLGIEPFSNNYKSEVLYDLFKNKKGPIKKWLLDQSLIAGLGNIYSDEACFHAQLKPQHKIENLKKKNFEKLFDSVLEALNLGIRNRGTSFSEHKEADYKDIYGEAGKNYAFLYVYGRAKKDCLRCGAILRKTKVAGRTTVYCGRCQR